MILWLFLWVMLWAGDDPVTLEDIHRWFVRGTKMPDTYRSNITMHYKEKWILDDLVCVVFGVMSYFQRWYPNI